MAGPSLSKLERERISQAAALAASGSKVQWRNVGRRVSYVIAGRDHLVLTSGSDRVHALLVKQVGEFYEVAHVEALRAATQETEGNTAGRVEGLEVHGVAGDSAPVSAGAGADDDTPRPKVRRRKERPAHNPVAAEPSPDPVGR
jgi:hypothetical protein